MSMKRLARISAALVAIFVPVIAAIAIPVMVFAQDSLPVPSSDELQALLVAIGGAKGAGALAVAALGVQAVMMLLRTGLGDLVGKYRLLIVYLLTVVSSVLALKMAGVGVGAALIHSQTIAAIQVFGNQVFRQFFVKTA